MPVSTMTRSAHAVYAAKHLLSRDSILAVEIGVQKGEHADTILATLSIRRLWLVDTWAPYDMVVPTQSKAHPRIRICLDFAEDLEAVFHRYQDDNRVCIMRESSLGAATHFVSGMLHFVYIDACHDLCAVSADIAAWWPKVAAGGVFAGHDYHSEWPGVIQAVDDFAVTVGRQLQQRERDWWFVK